MKLLIATFLLVFMRAIQSQNVIHGHYIMAGIVPYAIAVAEVATILWVIDAGWIAVPWVGAGGAIGATATMLVFGYIEYSKRLADTEEG